MMKSLFLLSLVFCGLVLSCSKPIEDNNVRTQDLTSAIPTAAVEPTPDQMVASGSLPNQMDVVLFDGRNYIKKSGWMLPSRKGIFEDKSYVDWNGNARTTAAGKPVKTTSTHYIYRNGWYYSLDFSFDGRDLDYMKGNFRADNFMERRVNGRVYMYYIGAEKILPRSPSNSYHEDPFIYRLMDTDGDGIFETLLGGSDEPVIVPNWVLK